MNCDKHLTQACCVQSVRRIWTGINSIWEVVESRNCQASCCWWNDKFRVLFVLFFFLMCFLFFFSSVFGVFFLSSFSFQLWELWNSTKWKTLYFCLPNNLWRRVFIEEQMKKEWPRGENCQLEEMKKSEKEGNWRQFYLCYCLADIEICFSHQLHQQEK